MKASGSLNFGLIKTISSKNKNFCIKSGCVYYVTLLYSDLKSLSFFPSVLPNNSDITFKRNFKLLEELEPYEIVGYTLLVPDDFHG